MPSDHKKRLLIFIVAYNAEKTIGNVLSRIPIKLAELYDLEVLIIDDSSNDNTFQTGLKSTHDLSLPFSTTILKNPINQGYGGNQKIGYKFAILQNFDYVALVHGDGQYAPESLPLLMEGFHNSQVSAVFGSRMMAKGAALLGGMPLYKFIGNKILTGFENYLLDTDLSEFHSGYRIYSVPALKKIPFDLNTNDFHFDTEIIIQLVASNLIIIEKPIPTYYGDEICRVNGMKYAKDVAMAVLRYRAQKLGIFYDRRFDLSYGDEDTNDFYQMKLEGTTTHTTTFSKIKPESNIVDIGCAAGYVGSWLINNKGCSVIGIDKYHHPNQTELSEFIEHEISMGLPPDINPKFLENILLLDIVEHLNSPEQFISKLAKQLRDSPNSTLFVSTGNIGFILIRLMLLFGQFNYGKRGILDLTHTRLFTFKSLRELFQQAGFEIVEEIGIPVPVYLIFKNKKMSAFINNINNALIRISKGLFSFQIYMIIKPKPSLDYLLKNAQNHSKNLTQDYTL